MIKFHCCLLYGVYGEGVNTVDCGSIMLGFESLYTPHILLLKYVDLVLVMSVEPGSGGQLFIESSVDKINTLYELRNQNNYNYVIEVDGGINDITAKKCSNADILVIGSFITNGDYQEQISKINL